MRKKITALLIAAAAVLALAACGAQSQTKTAFTVTYAWNGQVLHTEQVAPGGKPAGFAMNPDGAFFEGWQDVNGQTVDPKTVEVNANLRYTAVIVPELTGHGAYLPLKDGKAAPDSVLTGQELRYALEF